MRSWTLWTLTILLSIASIHGDGCGAAAGSAKGQNLIVNPSGEDDGGWTSIGPHPPTFIEAKAVPLHAASGEKVLNPGVDKHIYQDVSVSLYSTGQVFMFSTYIASLNQQPDKGSILLQWMAANGTVMQNISSNVWPVEMWQADAERWYSYQRRLMKPFGAAQIRVNLMAKAEAGPVQVYFDGVSLAANLLLNSGGENRDAHDNTHHPMGWTALPALGLQTGQSSEWLLLEEYKDLKAENGHRFFAPPPTSQEAYLYQDVDVSSFADNTVFLVESYQAAAVYQDASDTTTVKIQWKHANGTSLSEETVPFQSFTSMAWAPKRYIRMKPVGAAVCRLTLVARKTRFWHDGYDNRGFFDAIVFVPADHKAVFTTMDLRLGNVHVTDPGTRTVSIGNLGMFSSVMVTDLLLNQTEGAGNFSLSGTDVREVGPQCTVDYILHIDNTYPTTWVANLVIQLVDPVLPLVDIPISATITAQLAMFSVAEYDFGSVYTNRGSRNLNLILTSVGREPLQFLGVSTNFMGTGFELLSTPNPLTMQFQQQTQFPIQINTNTGPIGPNNGNITIFTDDPSHAAVVIPLYAIITDYTPELSDQRLQFQQVHVAEGPKTLSFNITNAGTSGRLEILSLSFQSGGASAQFSIDSTRSRALDPGETAVWHVTFNPAKPDGSAYGNAFSQVEIITNDDNRRNVFVQLEAFGSDHRISTDTKSMYLGSRHMLGGGFLQTQQLVIETTGTQGSLTIAAFEMVTADGSNSSFIIQQGSNPPSFPMGIGNQHRLDIAFYPILDGTGPVGLRNATLRIFSNDPYTPVYDVYLAGTAEDYRLAYDVTMVDFGDRHINAGPSYGYVVAVKNVGTLGDLMLMNTQIQGTDSNSFFVSAGQPGNTMVAPGEYHNVTIKFGPSSIGNKTTAVFQVQSTDPVDEWAKLPLRGRGVDQRLQVDSLFSQQFTQEQDTAAPMSAPLSLVIRNTGTLGDLELLTIEKQGLNPEQFILNVTATGPIAPGATRTFLVHFKPNVTGFLSFRLFLLANDAQPNGQSPEFSGNAIHPRISLSTQRVEFGQWDVTAGFRNFGNNNPFFQLLISNLGSTNLIMNGYTLTVNPSNSYSVNENGLGVNVGPGQTSQVNLAWDPNAPNGHQVGTLTIKSNDFLNGTLNVTLVGQAIYELGRLGPFLGNVSFQPPFSGQASTVRLILYTSDTGLPTDGKLFVDFPPGFDARSATAKIGGQPFGRDRVSVAGLEQVTINVVGSGLAAINKGQYIELDLYDVLLPSYADCLASYMNWRWNITTMDGQGRLLEFAFETNLPGEVCLPPKTFTMRTTPLLPDAPVGLQAGFHVRFTINVTEPARYMSMGLPLLDTRVGADQIKTVAAYKDGYPQYCSAHAEAEGGIIAFTDDVGDMDDAAVTNATFDTAFLPGTWRLCYRQVSGVFAWEQVGPEFSVTQKLMPNGTAYSFPNPQGIADPDTMQEEWFAQASALRVVENGAVGYSLVEPVRTIVDETVTYTFTGLNFHGGRQIYAKISYMSTTCAGNAPGTPAAGVLVQNGTAQFTVTEASVYKVCVQERAPFWFPLADLWVRTVVDANPPRPAPYPPFAGFQTCAGYLQHYTGRCGCFYGDGATAFTTLDEQDGVNLLLGTVPQNQTLNQGCCAMSADRHVVKTTHPKWGYCTKVTN
jgi:hypothetical protein